MRGGVYYRQIPKIMKSLEKKIGELDAPSVSRIWNIHHEFETIHPFRDGNGRTGRVLLNWLSLRYLQRLMIIEGRKREGYYNMIKEYTTKFRKLNPSVGFYVDKKWMI